MVKRKLKGKNAAKLKPEQKAKMEKTLERMDKTREQDSIRLRTKIESNIKEYVARLKKIDEFIQDAEIKKLRIEGAIVSLRELLNPENKA